jgi:predicted ATPase
LSCSRRYGGAEKTSGDRLGVFPPVGESSHAVFLSYASQDAEAATRICAALRAAGIEVWFDQSELRGGDAWDQAIRHQIRSCALFMPIISAHTEARREGYFRREWRLAADRTHDMSADVPFLVPVGIDDTPESSPRVPERFREVHWMRLPAGAVSPAFAPRIAALLVALDAPPEPQPRPRDLTAAEFKMDVSRSGATPAAPPSWMVGRLTELAALENRLAQAIKGRLQIVFVIGEPGIGKTTLLDVFADRHAASGELAYAMGRSAEHYGPSEAYLPLFDAITRLCHGPHGERLLHIFRRHAPSWLAQLPGLLGDAELETLRRRAVGGTRERMLRELADAITAFSTDTPLILRLEDLHWSDASTLDWLSYISRCREPARLLILSSMRPIEGLPREHPLARLLAESAVAKNCGSLRLRGLAATEVGEYLAAQFGEEPVCGSKPTALAEAIYARTEGNPLFVVNVANDLVERGVLIERDGTWSLAGRLEDIAATIPDDLRGLIELQLERLGSGERDILEVASAAGAEFSAATVAAALGQPTESVEKCCTEIARIGLFLRNAGSESWPDGTLANRLAFRHALYRATLYERLPTARRARLHVVIADRLEKAFGERARELAAELASHFELGGDVARAILYHHAAGDNAGARSAAREAIGHYRRALELLGGLADSRERTQREIALNIALGPLLLACEGFGAPAGEKAYKRAQELCDRIGATRELFTALWGLWLYNQGDGHFDDAKQIGQRLLGIAAGTHDRSLLLQAHHAVWPTSLFRGELLACIEHAAAGAELYEVGEHAGMAARYGNHDAGACGRCFHAVALALHGDLAAARAASQAAISLTEQLAHPFSQVIALCLAAMSEQIAGEHTVARQRAEQSARLAAEHGFAHMGAWASCIASWAMVVNGEHAPGISGIRVALNAAQATGTKMCQTYFFGLLADACRLAGSTSEGLAAVRSGLAAARTTNERFFEAELLRLESELERSTGTEAYRCAALLERAVEVSRHQAAHLLELRALTSLVRSREGEPCAAQLLRIGVLLESSALPDDSVDAREARLLLRGSQRNPTAIS